MRLLSPLGASLYEKCPPVRWFFPALGGMAGLRGDKFINLTPAFQEAPRDFLKPGDILQISPSLNSRQKALAIVTGRTPENALTLITSGQFGSGYHNQGEKIGEIELSQKTRFAFREKELDQCIETASQQLVKLFKTGPYASTPDGSFDFRGCLDEFGGITALSIRPDDFPETNFMPFRRFEVKIEKEAGEVIGLELNRAVDDRGCEIQASAVARLAATINQANFRLARLTTIERLLISALAAGTQGAGDFQAAWQILSKGQAPEIDRRTLEQYLDHRKSNSLAGPQQPSALFRQCLTFLQDHLRASMDPPLGTLFSRIFMDGGESVTYKLSQSPRVRMAFEKIKYG